MYRHDHVREQQAGSSLVGAASAGKAVCKSAKIRQLQVENKRFQEEEAGHPVEVIVLPFGSVPNLQA